MLRCCTHLLPRDGFTLLYGASSAATGEHAASFLLLLQPPVVLNTFCLPRGCSATALSRFLRVVCILYCGRRSPWQNERYINFHSTLPRMRSKAEG